MGWTGPYPTLSRKRPTADLVSRKVLTPLLGQIVICVLAQFAIFKAVQSQPWYISTPWNHSSIGSSKPAGLYPRRSTKTVLVSRTRKTRHSSFCHAFNTSLRAWSSALARLSDSQSSQTVCTSSGLYRAFTNTD